jgi:hypothetical protein
MRSNRATPPRSWWLVTSTSTSDFLTAVNRVAGRSSFPFLPQTSEIGRDLGAAPRQRFCPLCEDLGVELDAAGRLLAPARLQKNKDGGQGPPHLSGHGETRMTPSRARWRTLRGGPLFPNLGGRSRPQSSRHHAGRPPLTEHLSHLSP